jgi:hypothetical protein
VAWAADSAGNRKDQTVRLGMKSGLHVMYYVSSPFVLEIPGEDFTFGLVYGSGKFQTSSTSTTGYTTTTVTDTWVFSTTELTGRYYLGNSFNIPFGVAMYNIHLDEWEFLGTTWELDYTATQFNLGIGNEWTYDWGGYLGIDYYQGGSKLSDKITVTLKDGTEDTASKTSAEKQSTDMSAFAGALIFTFGFGF